MPSTVDLPTAYQTPRRCADGAGGLGPASRIERPSEFPPEAEHYRLHVRYMVDKRYYGHHPGATTTPPLRGTTAHPTDPNAWLLDEVIDSEVDNLQFFTRIFGNIPKSWQEISSANVQIPAIDYSETLGSATTITAGTFLLSTYSLQQTLTAASHGAIAGDRVFLNLRLRWFGSLIEKHISGTFAVSAADTNTFTVPIGPLGVPPTANLTAWVVQSPATVQVITGYPARSVRDRFVPVTIDHDYFLPGISVGVNSPDDIVLATAFQVQRGTEAAGYAANTISANTIPTAAQYWASITNRAKLVLDCALAPVLGPLLDRRTTSYTAQ